MLESSGLVSLTPKSMLGNEYRNWILQRNEDGFQEMDFVESWKRSKTISSRAKRPQRFESYLNDDDLYPRQENEFYGSAPGSGGYPTYFYESVPENILKKSGQHYSFEKESQRLQIYDFMEKIMNIDFWWSKLGFLNGNGVLEREDDGSVSESGSKYLKKILK